MVRAVQLESKINKGLYTRLGEDVATLKARISAEVSRGISTGKTFAQVAKQIEGQSRIGYNKAIRIARTEGHRIQTTATMDAMEVAKKKGADVLKQWSAFLDDRTRESHWNIHNEIRELDKPFSNGLMYPGDPSGKAEEVVNCRCALLQRARWALDEDEGTGYKEGRFAEFNGFTNQIQTFDGTDDFEQFKKAFFSPENKQYMNYVQQMQDKHGTKDFAKVLESMSDREYNHYSKLLTNNPVFRKKKDDEGVFSTFNLSKGDVIKPKSIMNELNRSEIGKETLEYLNKDNVPVRLYYGADNPNGVCGYYDPIDDEITIFGDVTKTTKETALTVIHEATHRKMGAKGTFDEEVACFKAEELHKKGHLTNSDISDIMEKVKKLYPELVKG
jgi:SPP1 gp7 family putative phage head morphogenesis protein